MTLRTRIAAVASVSVALAVLAAAIGLYVAVRSDLRGEIDSALRARARRCARRRRAAAPGRTGGTGLGPSGGYPGGGPPLGAGRLPEATARRAAGSPGQTSNRRRSGRRRATCSSSLRRARCSCPAGRAPRPRKIALTALDRAIAARGSGSSLSDRTSTGTKLRVLTLGTGPSGAVLVAQPLTEVEHELSQLLLILALIGGGRRGAGGAAGDAGGAHGAGADRALHASARRR